MFTKQNASLATRKCREVGFLCQLIPQLCSCSFKFLIFVFLSSTLFVILCPTANSLHLTSSSWPLPMPHRLQCPLCLNLWLRACPKRCNARGCTLRCSLVHLLIRLVNEIGEDAVWTLSTAKAGNGVQQLRDNNMQTFWQSDGLQPHLITLEFNKQVKQ